MKNLHGPFERVTDIYNSTRTLHFPSLTTDCCLVGIVIKRTLKQARECGHVWTGRMQMGQFSVVL